MRSLGGKWVELLKEIAPRLARVALLFNPPTATFVEGYLNPFRAAAAAADAEDPLGVAPCYIWPSRGKRVIDAALGARILLPDAKSEAGMRLREGRRQAR
jgi:hypothetical protein